MPDLPKLRPWKTLATNIALETPWFKIREVSMETPEGKPATYYIHDAHDSVICVAVRDDGKVLIEEQYRPPIERVSIDYPAGKMEADDAGTEAAIRRELLEEAGFAAKTIKQLAVLDKEPGFSSAHMHVFLARGSMGGDTHFDETENIETRFATPAEILAMIAAGKMTCTFCVSATLLAFKELGWLTASVER